MTLAKKLAKSERKEVLRRIEKKYKVKLGSGLPQDEKTQRFLAKYRTEDGSFKDGVPNFVRKHVSSE